MGFVSVRKAAFRGLFMASGGACFFVFIEQESAMKAVLGKEGRGQPAAHKKCHKRLWLMKR